MYKINLNADANSCGGSGSGSEDIKVPLELHGCMGLNACKGHDRYGTNECAGQGYCATNVHYCHTMNNCRNQGGCGLYGTAEEQCKPGQNECAWQGSCGTPIPAERFSTKGPNQGKSVWLLARKLFEERMEKSRRNVAPAPYECGPPVEWLLANGRGESCGSSGDKRCSYGFNDPTKNFEEMYDKSVREMDQTLNNCDCIKPAEIDCKKVLAKKCDESSKSKKVLKTVTKAVKKSKK